MSARSSLLLSLLALAACSKSAAAPEADPEKFTALAKRMVQHVPLPAGARTCTFPEMMGGATLTRKTFYTLAGEKLEARPENEDWVNPEELDSPAALELLNPATDPAVRRKAAAELLAAPFYLVYHVDLVDEPLPLGIKDFKKGSVGARALRYDRTGRATCVFVFFWSVDPNKRQWAISKTNLPAVAPEVKKELQQHVRAQMLARVAGLAAPAPVKDKSEPADDRNERQ